MKKITLLSLVTISALSMNAQEANEKTNNENSGFNKWTIEATVGQGKGVKPYSEGYYSSEPGTFLGKPQANSFSLATRYMFSPKFGVKAGLHFDELKNIKNNGSLPFKMQQIGLSVQGVVNATRLFDIQEALGRFGLLFHAGIRVDAMTSKTENIIENDHNYNKTEYNGGILVGVTPQFRFSKRMSLLLDVTVQNNYRQHFNWDGAYSDTSNNLNGQLITTSLGLTYSLGSNDIHGDWAVIEDRSGLKEIEALDKRVGSIETLMNDTDKDGVADYLDQENNSTAGVAVDTRGKMVDQNRNGVPDELEKYVNSSTKEASTKAQADAVNRLINEGYVATYFDTAKTKPTNVSTEGIDFIRTYMKNNPGTSVVIYGHADEIGTSTYNDNLSQARAQSVKDVLVKSGIDASRLSIAGQGEDNSVEKESDAARKLVRRVTFRVKE